jgi:hypothetical protein
MRTIRIVVVVITINQNNHMMQECLYDSLTRDCQLNLAQYKNEFTVGKQICGPLLLKVLMRRVTMDSMATIKSLKNALNSLETYAVEVKGNVPMITARFAELRNRLLAAGVEIDGLQDNLFKALKACSVEKFVSYIGTKEDSHDDGTTPISPDELIIVAQQKYNLMLDRGEWTVGTSKKDEIVVMRAELDGLKGQLALTSKTKAAGGEPGDDTKIKNKKYQKMDEAWKKIPPNAGEPHVKKIKNKDFHWCVHHMAWTVHRPDDCRLRPGAPDAAPPTITPTAAPATTTPTAMSAEAILGRLESAIGMAARY